MAKTADWENRIGRRLRLRDLHVFFAVAQFGSMKNAAADLRVTQPAVSKAILDLEMAVGVRLFDRSTRGVRPTVYGDALMKHGLDAFDALRQGVRQIESLADPGSGEVRVGCPESLSGMVASIIDRLAATHPTVVIHASPALPALMHLDDLRQYKVDLLLGRVPQAVVENDINVETLFEERLLVVTGAQNAWASRRKVSLGALVDEPWILVPKGNLLSTLALDVFRAHDEPLAHDRKVFCYDAQFCI
jgi:DNA-binding transcriptional LysR family regulator